MSSSVVNRTTPHLSPVLEVVCLSLLYGVSYKLYFNLDLQVLKYQFYVFCLPK
jgi:hypothetical protein